MVPRTLIDVADVPGGPAMSLFRRGDDFMIVIERNELMNSRMSGSEAALGTMSCARVNATKARVLIGGYGMGFTLRAVLGCVGPAAVVTVAELVPQVIAWARGPMAALSGGCLDDPRVTVIEDDVGAVIAGARGDYDAILLDVDNGPDGLTRRGNNQLYTAYGLAAARSALRPGGVLAVWSAAPDARFARKLREAGFAVEEVVVRARDDGAGGGASVGAARARTSIGAARARGKGPRHVIWFATKAG